MLAALKACLFGTALARFCSLWIVLVAAGAVFGTSLSGWDPEAGSVLSRIEGEATFPKMRQITAYMEVTF